MPWGWECRARLVKQVPVKPTERRGRSKSLTNPAPNSYDLPDIFCSKGFGRIKRAPAYTFGRLTKANYSKPVTTPFAPMFNVQNLGKTVVPSLILISITQVLQLLTLGSDQCPYKVTHSLVTPHIEPIADKSKNPGPAAYMPNARLRYKRQPAYTIRPPAREEYQPWDMWTPPPNMYCPDIPGKKPPAFSIGYTARDLPVPAIPGPGEHDPKFNYVKKSKPAYSFGHPFKELKPHKCPPPNTYCEKKFIYPKRSSPAPSFGIRHSRYLGEQGVYLKSSKLDLGTQ